MTVEAQPTSSPESLDLDASDEDLIHYVSQRKNDDPFPSNVIGNVNPFSIDPLAADVRNWYLCTFEDLGYAKGGKVRKGENGYWKQKGNDEQIHVNSHTNGRKVSWEFFSGNESSGDRAAWMILEYHINAKDIRDENEKQEFNSLCRIYFVNSYNPCLEERRNSVDVGENDVTEIEARLLTAHDLEKNNSSSESARESQVEVVDKKVPLLPTERCYGYRPDNAIDMQGYESYEDYIMLKDFDDEIGSSSSFENSSRFSETPDDDCFDAEALLLSLGGEGNHSIGQVSSVEVGADNNLPTQLVNESAPSVPEQSNGIDESVPLPSTGNGISRPGLPVATGANLYRLQRPTSPLALCIPSSSSTTRVLKSVFGQGSRQKRAASRSRSSDSSGSGSSRESTGRSPLEFGSPSDPGKSSSSSKIKRLGKKYCCLQPF